MRAKKKVFAVKPIRVRNLIMTWCRVVFVLAIFLLVRSLADGQEAAKAPFRLDEIIDFHKSDVPCRRLTILIGERGVGFSATPDMIRRLKSAGVCDSAVQTVEKVAPPPAAPATAVSELIEKGNAYLDQGQYAAAGEQFKRAKDSALLAKAERAAAYEKSIAGSDRFPLESIDGLLANLTPKRVSTLITDRGILCVPSETYMQRLEGSKVDERVFVAIEKKGLDNGRQIRKFQDAASSALDQGKYAEAIEEIEKAIPLCPASKVIIATRDRARSAQSTEASSRATPLDLAEIERLLKGRVTPKRVSNLIGAKRVNFTTLSEDGEKQLRSAGADNEVIAAIKVNLPAPAQPSPSGVPSPTPEAAIVMANQGKAILQQSNPNFNEALRTAEEALRIAPNYGDAWVLKGDALRGLKRFNEALESFNRAVALNVNDTPTLAKRGQVQLDLSQFNGAFQDLDRASKLNPAPPTIWILRGDSLAGLKRCADAKESYQKARERDPKGNFHLRITDRENRLKDCGP